MAKSTNNHHHNLSHHENNHSINSYQNGGDVEQGHPQIIPDQIADETTPMLANSSTSSHRHHHHLSEDATNIWFSLCALICCNSYIVAFIILSVIKLISVLSIILGALYINDCGGERNIPIVLITLSIVTLIVTSWHGAVLFGRKGQGHGRWSGPGGTRTRTGAATSCFSSSWWPFAFFVIKLHFIALFIYLCIMVYQLFNVVQFDDKAKDHYCGQLIYFYTFWLLSVMSISFMASLVLVIVVQLVKACWWWKSRTSVLY